MPKFKQSKVSAFWDFPPRCRRGATTNLRLHRQIAVDQVMKFSSQVEMVRENLVFDPGKYCSITLSKEFGPWNFDLQDYNYQMLCDSSLFPSKNKIFGNESVRFMSKRVRDLERFFASKWPDLRTNRLQGGYDAIPTTSCYDSTR
ncbi:hypothetical protein J1N35_034001 [Gossypium stocksii]|uniref:Uncharacterized protein n=1 Tax=Gossypium stocksii TaxID=47602 RepID=A0A9D3UR56_9ROSI|nr:hypothetical protein J1N35_034001 [Gossypium stocksii]